MIIWLIGMSGAGKSEIGKRLYNELKLKISNILYLDGDELRDAISFDLGYSPEDRYTSEKRRSRLCKLLSDQNIFVICSALSNAPDLRAWNKRYIKHYYEIYLQVDKNVLRERDSKGLYKKYSKNEIHNIVGEDIDFHKPENPWLTINNNGIKNPVEIVDGILHKITSERLLEAVS